MIDSLGDRLKQYEQAYDTAIINRVPIIIRVDGKNFSKWTKSIKANKPFDANFSNAMSYAMLETAKHIEGCVFGFTQSDEITFAVRNDQSLESTPWFGNRIQKIASVVSSMVTAHFASHMSGLPVAYFDARVFAVPSAQEIINVLIWRQNNCVKNSISCACYWEVGKAIGKKTARKEMEGLNQNKQQELLFQKAGINWNNYPNKYKRGIGCYKRTASLKNNNGEVYSRKVWELDDNLPIFSKNQDFLLNIISQDCEA